MNERTEFIRTYERIFDKLVTAPTSGVHLTQQEAKLLVDFLREIGLLKKPN